MDDHPELGLMDALVTYVFNLSRTEPARCIEDGRDFIERGGLGSVWLVDVRCSIASSLYQLDRNEEASAELDVAERELKVIKPDGVQQIVMKATEEIRKIRSYLAEDKAYYDNLAAQQASDDALLDENEAGVSAQMDQLSVALKSSPPASPTDAVMHTPASFAIGKHGTPPRPPAQEDPVTSSPPEPQTVRKSYAEMVKSSVDKSSLAVPSMSSGQRTRLVSQRTPEKPRPAKRVSKGPFTSIPNSPDPFM